MSEGGKTAVQADDQVVGAAEFRALKKHVRELERLLGKKCQTAPKSDPQSASKIDPLNVDVRPPSNRGGGGAPHWLLCLSLQLSLPVSMISQ